MTAKRLSLYWRCKTPRGWTRFPAIIDSQVIRGHEVKSARIGYVMDRGQLAHYPEGYFQIRRWENGRQVYQTLEAKVASAAWQVFEAAQNREKRAAAQGGTLRKPHTIKTAGDAYVKYLENKPAPEAAEQARLVVQEFERVCSSPYIKAVTASCIAAYRAALRKRDMSDRTIVNKDRRLRSFLRFAKVDVDAVMPSKDRPRHVKKLPHIYKRAQISAILAAADEYMGMVIDLGLMLGLREQEIMFATFSDVDFERAVFSVTSKPSIGFIVKDKEDRQVPIPRVLLERLRKRQTVAPGHRFIVGNAQDKPERHLLRLFKRLARKAGLNCGHCKGCTAPRKEQTIERKDGSSRTILVEPECREWTLHSLRRTYLTNMLRGGVDLSTVQAFAGHTDLDSTMRYLRPAETEEMQDAVNAIWGSIGEGVGRNSGETQTVSESNARPGRTRRKAARRGKPSPR